MNDTIWIVIWTVVIGGAFVWLWRAGYLARLTKYLEETREELRKCSWPTWEELKGSTAIVAICIAVLGGFTVAVDQILFRLFIILKL